LAIRHDDRRDDGAIVRDLHRHAGLVLERVQLNGVKILDLSQRGRAATNENEQATREFHTDLGMVRVQS
jgi:hypothetical protein